ncbi:hypothetical protein NPIL_669071 [Nephila pilipes]|uniref:Uncharacterized protein n=1 Tax=Nephila pilipes TaxID=299642 RepID=A0A8X6I627_NEPPI|nr:hypothetical protein NPIL_669071 [Nephila pilipes]
MYINETNRSLIKTKYTRREMRMRFRPTLTASACSPASARDPLSRGVRKRGVGKGEESLELSQKRHRSKATEVRVEATSKRHLDEEAGSKRFLNSDARWRILL